MQITINTADILGDEATIRDEVIAQVSNALITSMRKQASDLLKEMLDKNLKDVVRETVQTVTDLSVDTKFTDCDSYGRSTGKELSLRDRIAGFVQEQCTFKNTAYSSDNNAFTKVVKDVVEKEVSKFKTEFTTLVTRQVVQQSMETAVATLKESLGIK